MQTVVAVVKSPAVAERAVGALTALGVRADAIRLVFPQSADELERVPTADGERPGVGPVLGGVVGGAGGATLGMAISSLIVPGAGPVLVLGSLLAALGALGGAVGGAAVAGAMDETLAPGLPKDEVFVYEDALRQGRILVVAAVPGDALDEARRALGAAGAESVEAAREAWTIGLRSAEQEHYEPPAPPRA